MPLRKSLKRRSRKLSSKRLSKRLRTMKRNSKRMSRKRMRGGQGCSHERKSKRSMSGGNSDDGNMKYIAGIMLPPK